MESALEIFEAHRPRLRAVAYRMLGSLAEADDVVQEAWLRVDRAGVEGVDNAGGWLTTIVARLSLNVLQSRRSSETRLPDLIVSSSVDPADEAILAESVGLALDVVLETLDPASRLALVLHDMFGLSFDEIAPILSRTPAATRQLASRARRRVQGAAPVPDPDLVRQRSAVDAFFAAARRGDLDALIAVLAPDVTLRSDGGPSRPQLTESIRGAGEVASRAMRFSNPNAVLHPVLVQGAAGVVVTVGGRLFSIMAFTVVGGRIVAIDALVDPARLGELEGRIGL